MDVLFRPEEIHRASGEDGILPPLGGRNQAMKEEVIPAGAFVVDLDCNRFAAVRAAGVDRAVSM
jgi:hypothetical protein